MKLLNKPGTDFQDRTFQIEMTGKDLLHIWALSFRLECGGAFPGGNTKRRLFVQIQDMLDRSCEDFEQDFSKIGGMIE